jgi:hypothetical protein
MYTEDRAKKRTNPQANCRCQSCATCIDNARWERIFTEKFADPYYYTHPQVRNTSPMVDL